MENHLFQMEKHFFECAKNSSCSSEENIAEKSVRVPAWRLTPDRDAERIYKVRALPPEHMNNHCIILYKQRIRYMYMLM